MINILVITAFIFFIIVVGIDVIDNVLDYKISNKHKELIYNLYTISVSVTVLGIFAKLLTVYLLFK